MAVKPATIHTRFANFLLNKGVVKSEFTEFDCTCRALLVTLLLTGKIAQ